jgi:hypothetical protein
LKISTGLAAAIAFGSISVSAYAQTVTLDYQNDSVGGTYTSLPPGTTTTNPFTVSLPEASFTGNLTGYLTYTATYSSSSGFHGYTLDGEGFTLSGANGTQVAFVNGPFPLSYFGPTAPGTIGFFDDSINTTHPPRS